jgi:fumarate reductase subunit D
VKAGWALLDPRIWYMYEYLLGTFLAFKVHDADSVGDKFRVHRFAIPSIGRILLAIIVIFVDFHTRHPAHQKRKQA